MRSTASPGGTPGAAGPSRPLLRWRVVLAVVVAVAIGASIPHSAAAKPRCIDGSANEAVAAGSDEGPPKFTPAFFARVMSIDASADGLSEDTLPISIEEICGLPRSLEKQGTQLAGGDGVALIRTRTSVWKDGQRLAPDRKLAELDGADTVTMRARLLPQPSWKADEDGDPVPTFTTSRMTITD
jgi:hypothetical protein